LSSVAHTINKIRFKFIVFLWSTGRMIGGSSLARGWELFSLPLCYPPSLIYNGY